MMAIFRDKFDLEVSMSITKYANKWIAETLKIFYDGSGRKPLGSRAMRDVQIPLLGKYISRTFGSFSENERQRAGSQPISEVQLPSITNYISSFLRQLTILRSINLADSFISYHVYESKQSVIIRGYDHGVNFGLVIKNDGTLMEGMHFLDYHPKGGVDFKTGFKSVFCHETETNYITGQIIRERSLTEKHSDEVKKLLEGDLIAELKIDYQNNRETDFIYSTRFMDNKLHECRVEDLKIHSNEGLKGRAKNETKTFKSPYGYFAYRENLPYELVGQEK